MPPERAPWLRPWEIPGFAPDALPFALRTLLALLLAYAVSFAAQVQAASTAGICVAIVAQPSAGMAFSKAKYRLLGTLCGGVAGVVLLAVAPQDRTVLLVGYALWLGAGTFVGTLLRDFRSYGAVLSGYTAGVIAIAYIDAPAAGFVAALDRVAAIGIGIGSVLAVNLVTGGTTAFAALRAGLRTRLETVTAQAAAVLRGQPLPDDLALLGTANALTALRSQATFAGSERPDGAGRANAARHTIEALLGLLATTRLLALAVAPGHALSPAWRAHAEAAAGAIETGRAPPDPAPPAADPVQALLLHATARAMVLADAARAGLDALDTGGPALPATRIQVSHDWLGAGLGACRAIIAIGLCSLFTVLAGWSGATLLLIQSTAIIALLGATPNPTAASMPFLFALPPAVLAVGLIKFGLLPVASGFLPFALAMAPAVLLAAMISRHATLAPYGTPGLLFVTLLLSPTNVQSFDLAGYCNTALELLLSTAFVLATFRLILPVDPRRRLGRVAAEIVRHAAHPRHPATPQPPSLLYDRLARVTQWLGRPTPSRLRLLSQLYATGELDAVSRRARAGLDAAAAGAGAAPEARAAALRALDARDPAALLRAAAAVPAEPASWLAAAALVLRRTPALVGLARRVAP